MPEPKTRTILLAAVAAATVSGAAIPAVSAETLIIDGKEINCLTTPRYYNECRDEVYGGNGPIYDVKRRISHRGSGNFAIVKRTSRDVNRWEVFIDSSGGPKPSCVAYEKSSGAWLEARREGSKINARFHVVVPDDQGLRHRPAMRGPIKLSLNDGRSWEAGSASYTRLEGTDLMLTMNGKYSNNSASDLDPLQIASVFLEGGTLEVSMDLNNDGRYDGERDHRTKVALPFMKISVLAEHVKNCLDTLDRDLQ